MDQSSCGIADIPNEILLTIFSNLPPSTVVLRLVQVSERWKNLINCDVMFWNKLLVVIDCDNFINFTCLKEYDDSSEKFLPDTENEIYIGEHDLNLVSNMSRLRLEWGSHAKIHPSLLLIRILDIVRKTCAKIQFFEFFHCCGATSSTFIQFLNKHYTDLVEIKFGVNSIYDIPYEEFSKFDHLTTLVSDDYKFKSPDLHCIADCCPSLTKLWILLTRAIKNDDVLYFLDRKKLTIEEIGVGARLGDSVLNKVNECKKLKVLFLGDARDVTESGLTNLAQSSWIKYISLHRLNVNIGSLTRWMALMESVPVKVIDLTKYAHESSVMVKTPSQVCAVYVDLLLLLIFRQR